MLKQKIDYVFLTHRDFPRHPFQDSLKKIEWRLRELSMPVRTGELPGVALQEYTHVRRGRRRLAVMARATPPVGIWVPDWAAAISIICLWRAYTTAKSDSSWQRALDTMDMGLETPPDRTELLSLLAVFRLGQQDRAWRRVRFLVRKVREKAGLTHSMASR